MRRPRAFVAALVIGASLASCRDVPAPESGVLSISALILPSPALVAGDTMRDSTGASAPLRVIAYGVGGVALDPQPTASFVLLDTAVAHLAGPLIIGDKAGATVHVVGTVAGLQTLAVALPVTLEPDTLVASDSTHQVRTFSLQALDTAVNAELNVQALNLTGTASGVDGVIVNYAITSAPPAVGSGAPVVLLNSGALSSRDTTSSQGRASRTLRLRLASAALKTDSATVSATASYRGQSIGTVQFTIVFKAQ